MTEELPEDFDPALYLLHNKDVADAGIDPKWHYLTHGKAEGRPYRGNQLLAKQIAIELPLGYTPHPHRMKIAIICHLFYCNFIDHLLSRFADFPEGTDIYISTDTEAKRDEIGRAFSSWRRGNVYVVITPNKGRDIAPKLIAFRDVYSKYDLVVHVHTKKSPHEGNLKNWGTFLHDNLMGSKEIIDGYIECFRANPELGIAGPQHIEFIRNWVHWGPNYPAARPLIRSMGLKLLESDAIDFITGSMFWARPKALKPILDLDLSFDDFPAESGQVDGTLAHAIERLYLYVCEKAGYKWVKVATPGNFTSLTNVIKIGSDDELVSFIRGEPLWVGMAYNK
ncbi:rhamnan synthesis F family protein [Rhizobium leucaenae]|uniref:rhamnan synthesis F family protein n=1 Tax=Rhizobium leucaenae TaxID=29450 RepID=UPI0007EE8553|nr:rhamnan synthesis F family protein [Rhizobium leucaenae]MBB6299895.1 lipopolysaccharide biosynthesis protein [Rhizobium leucaenae]